MAGKKVVASTKLSVYCSSAEDFNNACDICITEGDHVSAVGYCKTCQEYMCSPCFKSHSKSKASRNHDLFDKTSMPQMSRNVPTTTATTVGAEIGSSECNEDYTLIRNIDVKTDNDKKVSYITAMALLSGSKLAVVDQHNKSLKLLDTKNDSIIGELSFEDCPVGITSISDDELAATFGTVHKIKIITTNQGLNVTRSSKVAGRCWAITFCNGQLFVSFHDPLKFQILGLSGAVKRTIKPDSNVKDICTHPSFIAAHPDEKSIFVSDWKNNAILRVDMNGAMLALFKDECMECPSDMICFPSGSIYISSRETSVLYKMPADLSEAIVILEKLDGLMEPMAMSYNYDKKICFLSTSSDCIQVFEHK